MDGHHSQWEMQSVIMDGHHSQWEMTVVHDKIWNQTLVCHWSINTNSNMNGNGNIWNAHFTLTFHRVVSHLMLKFKCLWFCAPISHSFSTLSFMCNNRDAFSLRSACMGRNFETHNIQAMQSALSHCISKPKKHHFMHENHATWVEEFTSAGCGKV